jgi:hypothetical protein
MSAKIILDLCGGTGSWSKPYRDNGYDVRVITFPDYDVEKWREYPEIVELVTSNSVYGVLAAPPCTMFSIARNDKTAKEQRDLRKGMKTVNACLDLIHECIYNPYRVDKNNLKFWALENPASGYLKRYLGYPPFVFDPSEYGDEHSKKTAIWGMFREPKKTTKFQVKSGDENNYVKSVEKFFHLKAHLIPQGYREKTGLSMRTVVRSITPQGFAQAFFEANK